MGDQCYSTDSRLNMHAYMGTQICLIKGLAVVLLVSFALLSSSEYRVMATEFMSRNWRRLKRVFHKHGRQLPPVECMAEQDHDGASRHSARPRTCSSQLSPSKCTLRCNHVGVVEVGTQSELTLKVKICHHANCQTVKLLLCTFLVGERKWLCLYFQAWRPILLPSHSQIKQEVY